MKSYVMRYLKGLKEKSNNWLTFNELNVLQGFSHLGTRNSDAQTTWQAIHHLFIASARA